MTPSWYDVLGVAPDATTEEIREAWRTSVADLDPTDRLFRQRNRAAEVLLDPERRAAHDADLTADQDADDAADASAADDAGATEGAVLDPVVVLDDAPADPVDDAIVVAGRGTATRLVWATAILGALALVLVVATVIAAVRVGDDSAPDAEAAGSGTVSTSDSLPDAQQVADAQGAAEAAIVPVLSYDYRTLSKNEQEAASYMTPDFAKEYQQYFAAGVAANAPASKAVVRVQVIDSGIVRTGPGRVDVLLFVNRPTSNKVRTVTYHDQVTARMVDTDGTWLVGCLITQPDGVCGTS